MKTWSLFSSAIMITRESKKRKNFVVFHLIGNHFEYKNRFPKEFSRFNLNNTSYFSQNKSLRVTNNTDKQVVTDYINSVYYNDYVLHSLIELFKDKDSLVIYLSDHGDDMFESSAFNTHECKCQRRNPILNLYERYIQTKTPPNGKKLWRSFTQAFHERWFIAYFVAIGRNNNQRLWKNEGFA